MAGNSNRLNVEMLRIMKNPPPGITFTRRKSEENVIDVDLVGMEGSPFEGGLFKLVIITPHNYPFQPPLVRFVTPVYHPNIDERGLICLDVLKPMPAGSWRPVIHLAVVMTSVRLLMTTPNTDDPLMPAIAEQYVYNKALYEETARAWTKKYAMGGPTEAVVRPSVKSLKEAAPEESLQSFTV